MPLFGSKDKTSDDSLDIMANILQNLFKEHHEDLRIMRSTISAQAAVIGLLKSSKVSQNDKDVPEHVEWQNKVGFNTLEKLMSIQHGLVICAENRFKKIKIWLYDIIGKCNKLPPAFVSLKEGIKSNQNKSKYDTQQIKSNKTKGTTQENSSKNKTGRQHDNETQNVKTDKEDTKYPAESVTNDNADDTFENIESDHEAKENRWFELLKELTRHFYDRKIIEENGLSGVPNPPKDRKFVDTKDDYDVKEDPNVNREEDDSSKNMNNKQLHDGECMKDMLESDPCQHLTIDVNDDKQATSDFYQKEIRPVLETIEEMVGLIEVKTESQNQEVENHPMSNNEVSEILRIIHNELFNLGDNNKRCKKAEQTIKQMEETLKLAAMREKEQKQKTVDLQLYFLRNDDVMMNVVRYMSTTIRDKLKGCKIDATIEYCNTPKQIKPNVPVLVLFINCSRLVTDGIAAIKGINSEDRRHIALVAFHHIDVGFAIEKGAIVGSQFNGIAGVHHMAFTTEKGVYERNENEVAINAIVSFVINLSK